MSEFITVRLPESEKAKFKDWLSKQNAEIKRECQILIVSTLYDIDRNAKMFVPHDTGFLAGSLHPKINADKLGGTVGAYDEKGGRYYAPYVEFGTGTGVVAPADVADYAITFKGKGVRKVNTRAQPYLFPAARIAQQRMFEKLEEMGFKRV
jgi:hypothetical protein